MRTSSTLLLTIMVAVLGCGGTSAVGVDARKPIAEYAENIEKAPVSRPIGPSDGIACTGTIAPLPEGVREVTDEALARSAIDESGKGKLCMARVFEVITPVKVFRVWNSSKTYTEFGKWWSFAKPTGPLEIFRAQNAVCPEWSDLDRLTVCEMKVGARFAVGPGQSATCSATKYEKSAVNQVFIPNDTREQKVFVDHCEQLGAFP